MISVTPDAVVFGECLVIMACLAFQLWWLSPGQRRKRLRTEARDRIRVRRLLIGPPLPRPSAR